MRAYLGIMLSLIVFSSMYSQTFKTDSISKSEISKLQFMTGNWEGEGWMMTSSGTMEKFNQTENIQFKLDSTTVLIEGLGISHGQIIHNAMAIVSYDKENNNYTFQSYLQNGRKGEFKAEIIGDKFYWYPNQNMRYIIKVNDKGQWFEIGEIKQGENWFQFFEMTLNKI